MTREPRLCPCALIQYQRPQRNKLGTVRSLALAENRHLERAEVLRAPGARISGALLDVLEGPEGRLTCPQRGAG